MPAKASAPTTKTTNPNASIGLMTRDMAYGYSPLSKVPLWRTSLRTPLAGVVGRSPDFRRRERSEAANGCALCTTATSESHALHPGPPAPPAADNPLQPAGFY